MFGARNHHVGHENIWRENEGREERNAYIPRRNNVVINSISSKYDAFFLNIEINVIMYICGKANGGSAGAPSRQAIRLKYVSVTTA
jgi:hypothetical protein